MNRRSFLGTVLSAVAASRTALTKGAHREIERQEKEVLLEGVRIVQVDDMAPIGYMATSPTRRDIEKHVAKYANNGVDALVFDLANVDHCVYKSKVSETFPPRNGEGLELPLRTMIRHPIRNAWSMIDGGIDLPAVLAESVHRQGMRFWPGMRLNTSNYQSRLKQNHPDWVLPMAPHVIPGCLDYEQEGVRSHVLAQARELVENYEADGLYLNFTRYEGLFHPDRVVVNTDLLTGWLGEIRAMLDEVAATKGKRYLPLAAQVLSRMQDGLRHGHDYRAWAQQGFVDYLCPARENHMDFNLPVHQWLKAVQGTPCRVFPVLQPSLGYGGRTLREPQMTRDKFRAAVHNYYEAGAHGLSTMNLIYVDEFNPLFLELRDANQVARGSHHYHFANPAHSSYDGNLNYSLEPNVLRQDYRFRVETDPTQRKPGTLKVTLANVHRSDMVEIDLNHKPLPRYPQWGVVDSSEAFGGSQGHRRIALGGEHDGVRTYRYEASLAGLPLRKGENALGLRIASRGLGVEAPRPTFHGLEVLI